MKCIYCLEEKGKNDFKDKEHVLPQSFGKFENNFTLRKEVCNDCNQFFGDKLEIYLAGDTFEGGTLRYNYGIKKPEKFKSLGRRSRIIYRQMDGKHPGKYLYQEYSEEAKGMIVAPCPQIGFLKKSGEYEWYLLDDRPTQGQLYDDTYDVHNPEFCLLVGSDREHEEKILKEYGMNKTHSFTTPDNFNNGGTLCEVRRVLDEELFRAIAKIGFNYLTYWKGADFVLHNDFDTIRRYIRWGEIPEIPVRGIVNERFLPDERDQKKRRFGHIIAVHWEQQEKSLVVHVSLLNFIHYIIRLAVDHSGKYQGIKKGHFFNLKQRNILELNLPYLGF